MGCSESRVNTTNTKNAPNSQINETSSKSDSLNQNDNFIKKESTLITKQETTTDPEMYNIVYIFLKERYTEGSELDKLIQEYANSLRQNPDCILYIACLNKDNGKLGLFGKWKNNGYSFPILVSFFGFLFQEIFDNS